MILQYNGTEFTQVQIYFGLTYVESINSSAQPIPPRPINPDEITTIPDGSVDDPVIIAKFSDYVIQTIEFFVNKIETELSIREIRGLTNNKIEIINVKKQHPLVELMSSALNGRSTILRSGIIPAISVTSGNVTDDGFTLGQSYQTEIVNDAFIEELKGYLEKTNKEKLEDVILTNKQIETIIGIYNRTPERGMKVQMHEFHKKEEINVSVWSDSPDIDILLGNLMDSILAGIQVGFAGDGSNIKKLEYRSNKGLTNFNFGRVLYGTEYNLSFFNVFNNYTVYTDAVISGHDFYGIFNTQGSVSGTFKAVLGASDPETFDDETAVTAETYTTPVIISKFSDYVIHSIEYFITKIENEIGYRSLPEIFNNKIEKINITKEHPLSTLMAAELSDVRNADALRASIIPAISITPGNLNEHGFTLGQSYKTEAIDDTFIDQLKAYLEKTNKEIQDDVLITKDQISNIISEYNRLSAGKMRSQQNEWHRKEEITIAVWSDTPDVDILLGNLMDSILAEIQVGFAGDNSILRDFSYKSSKGLTNFNFGRTLFGTEYNLTFLNSFNNYIIYTDDVLTEHDLIATFETPGE